MYHFKKQLHLRVLKVYYIFNLLNNHIILATKHRIMVLKNIFSYCLALTLITGFASTSFAQKGKSEVSVAYGYYSMYDFYTGRPYSTSSGVGMINYKYYLSNNVTIGGTIAYENNSNANIGGGSYLSFVPEFTYTYLDTKEDRVRVKLYGGASFGLTVYQDLNPYTSIDNVHHDGSGPEPTGQVTPFGIRIGRRFAGFAEIGYGYKGLFSFGLSYRFRTAKAPKKQD